MPSALTQSCWPNHQCIRVCTRPTSSAGRRDMIPQSLPVRPPPINRPLSPRFLRLSAALFVLFILIAGLFYYRLDARDLWASHEARAAQNAQRILDDGAWGLPRLL